MLRSDTLVRRLRIRTTPADVLALQRRVAEMTAAADLTGSFLTPAAILCIRKLDDPRPRTLRLADRGLRPVREWEAAARSRISELAARAARPALGPVPASTEAVLFLDRSELLACLARDWSERVVASRWWWSALFRASDEAASVMREWRGAPEHVPAACHLLASWRCLDLFIQRLPPSDASSLTREVARAFGIDAVERALTESTSSARDMRESAASAASARQMSCAPDMRNVLASRVPDLPLAMWTPEGRALAVVALILHRAPCEARRILSADAVESMLAPEMAPRPSIVEAAPRPTSSVRSHAAARDFANQTLDDRGASAAAIVPGPVDARVARGLLPDGPLEDESQPLAARDGGALEVSTRSEPASLPSHARPIEAVVETEFGGAFYLINVGIDLGLYGDFTAPRSPGIDLPIWDFIRLVAERLIADERFRKDPIVPFLARLAGRDPEVSAPAATPSRGHGNPRRGVSESWRRGWGPAATAKKKDDLDSLAAQVLARLSGALGVEPDAVGAVVIQRAARVSLSPSHLDVAFRLDDLPIAIRLAGLDRDPGFVPAAGLTVTFSYV